MHGTSVMELRRRYRRWGAAAAVLLAAASLSFIQAEGWRLEAGGEKKEDGVCKKPSLEPDYCAPPLEEKTDDAAKYATEGADLPGPTLQARNNPIPADAPTRVEVNTADDVDPLRLVGVEEEPFADAPGSPNSALNTQHSALVPPVAHAPGSPNSALNTQHSTLVPPVSGLQPPASSLQPVGCSSCGGGDGLLRRSGSGQPPASGCCGGGGPCAGQKPCSPCEGSTVVGRFLCGVYQCVCCPDPCYKPEWQPIADAAFFVEAARPQTQQRLRWDAGNNLLFPDRSEFFWPRADGFGIGPFPKVPARGEKRVDYNELSLYTETATGFISVFVNVPYRSIEPELANHAAGFGDMDLGTKTLLYDCELFQLSMQMRTYLPVGNFTKGLGTGHVSIEPSLILGVRVGPDTYFQGQIAEWIPFGEPGYAGSVLHYHASLNHVLYRVLPDVPLIGTMEVNGWTFQDGSYTDPVLGTMRSSGETYLSLGPGFRLVICDKLDFGVGTAFSVTGHHWADQLFRSECRIRF